MSKPTREEIIALGDAIDQKGLDRVKAFVKEAEERKVSGHARNTNSVDEAAFAKVTSLVGKIRKQTTKTGHTSTPLPQEKTMSLGAQR